ncbi:MAG: DUF4349 domain-containing protein [Candidatus Spyradocola sp.]
MKCERIREAMDGYLDGSLTPLEMEAVEAHVEQCEECREELARRREMFAQLGQLDEGVKAPEGLLEGAMERIHQQRSPRKKAGWWIAGGIAAALCVTAGLAGLALGGGGAKSDAPQEPIADYGFASGAAMDVAADMAVEGAYDMPAEAEENWIVEAPAAEPAPMPDTGAVETMTQKSAAAETQDTAQYGLKIIRDAYIQIQTENYDADVEQLRALVEEFGGFITSSEEDGSAAYNERYGGSNRYVNMSVRVPSGSLDNFLELAKQVGIVTGSSITESDVTASYVDTDRRLQAYQKQYDRVLAMMDQAETVEELITIESELSRLEMEIENCQGQLNYWDSRVGYSTVNIFVDEVRRAVTVVEDASLGERMRSALADSWYGFVEGAKDALVNMYAALPYIAVWVIVLGAAAVVVVIIVRGVRKKRKDR